MTAVRLDSKLATNAQLGLEPFVPALYAQPGKRVVGVIEVAHVERTEVAPGEDKEPSVKLQVKHLEIANEDQTDVIHEAMRALYLQRTASGTFTEDGDIELSGRTLQLTAGRLADVEVARLRVGLSHWAQYAYHVLATSNPTATELMHELKTVVDGLYAVLNPATTTQTAEV